MHQRHHLLTAASIALLHLASLPEASAVGYGPTFEVYEGAVAGAHDRDPFKADSLDFTYHACVQVGGPLNRRMREVGYFWVSSYQLGDALNNGTVVDSQINYYEDNGYRIYAKYTYQAAEAMAPQPTITGDRLSYLVGAENASIELFIDPAKDTKLEIFDNCELSIVDDANDDELLGSATGVAQGEKYEADGLANGDFKVVFYNWQWGSSDLLIPTDNGDFNYLVFNGNVTELGGALRDYHRPEGSGNLFWLEDFDPIWTD